MSNREERLDALFDQARRQPSLISRAEAEGVVNSAETVETTGGPGRGGRYLAPAALLLLLLLGSVSLMVMQSEEKRDLRHVNSPTITSSVPTAQGDPLPRADDQAEPQVVSSPNESVRRSGSASNPFDDALHTEPVTEPVAQSDAAEKASSAVEPVDDILAIDRIGLVDGIGAESRTILEARARLTAEEISPETDTEIEVIPLGDEINVPDFDDYNPMVTADGRTLYFVSNRPHGLGGHDFWAATKSSRGGVEFSEPHNLGSTINTSRSEGAATISADGSSIVFTACNRPDGVGDCDLYEAELHGSEWKNIRNLRPVNSPYWESQPTLSADGRTLLFVTDRPGNLGRFGDFDIWISERGRDGRWSLPRNLGASINTPEHEDSPFLAADGSLYFSSAGHPGFGGLDFFVSRPGPSAEWTTPENMGPEINSDRDERFISLPAAGDVIYFASEAPGSNSRTLDLFMARRAATSDAAVIHGDVTLDETPLAEADILFVSPVDGRVLGYSRLNGETDEYSLVLARGDRPSRIQAIGLTSGGETFAVEFPLAPGKGYQEWRCDIVVTRKSIGMMPLPVLSRAQYLPELDQLTIENAAVAADDFEVVDIWGNVQMTGSLGAKEVFSTSAANLAEGLYLLTTSTGSSPFRVERRDH